MAETIYATYSAGVNDADGITAQWDPSATLTVGSERRVLYRFPRLEDYKSAKSITLTLYRASGATATCTTNLWANATNTGSSSSATGAVSLGSFSSTGSSGVADVDLTQYISTLTNMSGSLTYVNFILTHKSGGYPTFAAYNASGKKAKLTIEMSSGGTVHYCTGGVWTPCEAYFCTGGAWKKSEARYGTGGQWKELGE